jgi:lipoyl-dependent peroxiredoxin
MPEHLQGVLSTAAAVVEGGREDHGRSLDGRLDADLPAPESMGGSGGPGTNPEELFAVGIGPAGHGGFGLTVAPDLHAPHLTAEQAADVMVRAHQRCPYSNATRGNIDVELSVGGMLLPTWAKLACGIVGPDGST